PTPLAASRVGSGSRGLGVVSPRPGAGVELHAKPGDTVTAGQPLLTLHTDTPEKFEYALESVAGSYDVAPAGTGFTANPIVLERIA
ncbi:thymidine phosphorylase, partial [Streptomyces violascens]